MQKRISVEFAMVTEIPAEPIAESIRRKEMVSLKFQRQCMSAVCTCVYVISCYHISEIHVPSHTNPAKDLRFLVVVRRHGVS